MSIIQLFNSTVGILNSVVEMEGSISQLTKAGEELATSFASGKVDAAQAGCDNLMKALQAFEEVFKTKTLAPAMALYKLIEGK